MRSCVTCGCTISIFAGRSPPAVFHRVSIGCTTAWRRAPRSFAMAALAWSLATLSTMSIGLSSNRSYDDSGVVGAGSCLDCSLTMLSRRAPGSLAHPASRAIATTGIRKRFISVLPSAPVTSAARRWRREAPRIEGGLLLRFRGGQGLADQLDDLGREESGLMELFRQHAGLAERPRQGAEVER